MSTTVNINSVEQVSSFRKERTLLLLKAEAIGMQSYLPLKETADITSGCHMAVGSTILLSGWDHYLSWGRSCVFFLFFFFNPWTDSVPDVQWMLQKGFNSQLRMSVTSQTPTQVGTISSTSLTYRHLACNFTDSMIGTLFMFQPVTCGTAPVGTPQLQCTCALHSPVAVV